MCASSKSPSSHWLVKSEPESYSWADFGRDRHTAWTGVRNFAARNHLRAMKVGDRVLFYESVGPKAVLGLARVSRAAFADPTAEEGDWVAVELKVDSALKQPVTLARIKADPALANMVLLRNSRLSVQPVQPVEWERIVALGK